MFNNVIGNLIAPRQRSEDYRLLAFGGQTLIWENEKRETVSILSYINRNPVSLSPGCYIHVNVKCQVLPKSAPKLVKDQCMPFEPEHLQLFLKNTYGDKPGRRATKSCIFRASWLILSSGKKRRGI
jgi:hypothetical protein